MTSVAPAKGARSIATADRHVRRSTWMKSARSRPPSTPMWRAGPRLRVAKRLQIHHNLPDGAMVRSPGFADRVKCTPQVVSLDFNWEEAWTRRGGS